MDQAVFLNVDLAGGWRLIGALADRGYPVAAALWVRLDGEELWRLYLASPRVDPSTDDGGLRAFFQVIHSVLRSTPDIGVDPFLIRVVGVTHPVTRTALELSQPNGANPKPHGVTRFDGGSLGGYQVDGAFIYPPWEPGLTPAW